jgi:5'-nucleotidase
MDKKIVYVDMDGVLVDIHSEINKIPNDIRLKLGNQIDTYMGLFENPKPIEGAIDAFKLLCEKHDVYILTTAPWDNPEAWTHKRLWVERYLGEYGYKRLITSHYKNLLKGEYLIDDRLVNGASEFEGIHIHFGYNPFKDWNDVLKYLL